MGKKPGGRKRQGAIPPPKCKALLLCDQTIIEAVTGKVSLIGTFTAFNLSAFPGVTPPFTVFIQLTDGIGRYEVVVEVHNLQTDQVLARAAGLGIAFQERLGGVNIALPVPGLPLAEPGAYDLVVFANGAEIDRQRFVAVGPAGERHGADDSE